MNFGIVGRLAGVVALTAGLAGCIDVTAEIDVLSETGGRATTTMTMGAEFYPMIKQMAAASEAGSDDGFCTEESAVLTENADGSATCTIVGEGSFADITGTEGPTEEASFTVVSPGVVRVGFKTEGMASDVTDGQDAEAAAMMKAYFEGHEIIIRIKGKRIIETNMTAVGGNAAETVITWTSLLDGTANLPDELFAVVDTR